MRIYTNNSIVSCSICFRHVNKSHKNKHNIKHILCSPNLFNFKNCLFFHQHTDFTVFIRAVECCAVQLIPNFITIHKINIIHLLLTTMFYV